MLTLFYRIARVLPNLSKKLTAMANEWTKIKAQHRRTYRPIANVKDHSAGDVYVEKIEPGTLTVCLFSKLGLINCSIQVADFRTIDKRQLTLLIKFSIYRIL